MIQRIRITFIIALLLPLSALAQTNDKEAKINLWEYVDANDSTVVDTNLILN